jgi:hypothetical protein
LPIALHRREHACLHHAAVGDEERPFEAEDLALLRQKLDRPEIELLARIDECQSHLLDRR